MTISQAFDLELRRHRSGRLAEAESLYRQILAAQPKHAEALHFLGVIAHQTGRHDLALEWIHRSIVIDPKNPSAFSNLGEACRAMGRLDEAIANFRLAIELKPDYPEAHSNLGAALVERGQADAAIAACRRAIELKPGCSEAYNNLGNALLALGQLDEAIAAYRRSLELKPDYTLAHLNLGAALCERGQLDAAVAACRRALEFKPDSAEAYNNLGNALRHCGQIEEAVAAYRQALNFGPGRASAHSNLIYALHFHPGHDAGSISEERRRWNRQFGEPWRSFLAPHPNDRDPDRRLRIGYVSPDFRDHVVGRNLLPLFQRHDTRSFEIVCYSGVARPDEFTDQIRQRASLWRDTVGLDDEALADMIRRDGADILVDLSQHIRGNRLPMFARKPAPVQVSFAGYPDSAGLEMIEYRISDRYLEARNLDEGTAHREQVRFIDSFWCYDPCGMEVAVNSLPALRSRRVTFGCLNNFCKVNEPVLRLWARALGRVTNSRLAILSTVGSHRQRVIEILETGGIDPQRVEFLDSRPRREYLELYQQLDIVLDTFPYNGHTTSLDALWMGVPVVSLAGETPVSRAGLSQLSNLGLPEWVAHSETEYVNIAERLALDLERLARLRATLRDRMENSVLMDAPRFARNVEAAYRSMWERWCEDPSPRPGSSDKSDKSDP